MTNLLHVLNRRFTVAGELGGDVAGTEVRKPRQPDTSNAVVQAPCNPGAINAVSLLSRSQRRPAPAPRIREMQKLVASAVGRAQAVTEASLVSSWPVHLPWLPAVRTD